MENETMASLVERKIDHTNKIIHLHNKYSPLISITCVRKNDEFNNEITKIIVNYLKKSSELMKPQTC